MTHSKWLTLPCCKIPYRNTHCILLDEESSHSILSLQKTHTNFPYNNHLTHSRSSDVAWIVFGIAASAARKCQWQEKVSELAWRKWENDSRSSRRFYKRCSKHGLAPCIQASSLPPKRCLFLTNHLKIKKGLIKITEKLTMFGLTKI